MSQKEQIIADYQGGMTGAEVAEKYGRSRNGLYVCLSRWGVKLNSEDKGRRIREGKEKAACVKISM